MSFTVSSNIRFEEILISTDTTLAATADLDYIQYVNNGTVPVKLTVPAPIVINGVAGAVIELEPQNSVQFIANDTGNGYNAVIPTGGAKLKYDVITNGFSFLPNKRYQFRENTGGDIVTNVNVANFPTDGEAFYIHNASTDFQIEIKFPAGINVFIDNQKALHTSSTVDTVFVVEASEEYIINRREIDGGFYIHKLNQASEGQYVTVQSFTATWNTITHNLGLVDPRGFTDKYLIDFDGTSEKEIGFADYRNYTANSFEVRANTPYTDVHVTVLSANSSNSVITVETDFAAIPVFNSHTEAVASLGTGKLFRYSQTNVNGVSSPNGSTTGITQ